MCFYVSMLVCVLACMCRKDCNSLKIVPTLVTWRVALVQRTVTGERERFLKTRFILYGYHVTLLTWLKKNIVLCLISKRSLLFESVRTVRDKISTKADIQSNYLVINMTLQSDKNISVEECDKILKYIFNSWKLTP